MTKYSKEGKNHYRAGTSKRRLGTYVKKEKTLDFVNYVMGLKVANDYLVIPVSRLTLFSITNTLNLINVQIRIQRSRNISDII